MTSKNLKRIFLWTLGIFILVAILMIVFISPLTKYMVEKYDEEILGRQVTIGTAYVNPFTGYIYFKKVKVFEEKSDSLFLTADGLSVNFEVFKLLKGNYEISEIKLQHPEGIFRQKDSSLNLDDIIERFSSKDNIPNPNKKKVKFNIKSIIINDGIFHYSEEVIPIYYTIKKVYINSTGFKWDSDTMRAQFAFIPSNEKGEAKGDITINTKNQDYRFATVLKKYDLKFIEQYLKDLARYGSFDANLDADITASGNFLNAEKLDAKGILAVNGFRFGKNEEEAYASFEKLVVDINRLNPAQHMYLFDSAILTKPFIKYERYDYLDNFENMFGEGGKNVMQAKSNPSRFNLIFEIADYVTILARNFFSSNYKINRIAIIDGNVKYNDYALNEKFAAEVNPLNVFADSIAKNKSRVKMQLSTGLKPYGNMSLFLSINPKDSSDFDINYKIEKVPTAMFNPYLITYTSFQMDRGSIELNGIWHVRNGSIQSENHLLVVDPRLGKRIKKKDAMRLPLPLIMFFVKERGNVIDYEIPITGNLNHPKFHLRDVILDILSNIFAKPPTTGYRIKVREVEREIEKSLTLKWDMRQTELVREQEKFLDKMSDYLKENQDASIHINPQWYEAKEKEHILFYEAKKKYFKLVNEITENEFSMDDSIRVEKMSVKDSFFVHYLDKTLKNNMLFTIQAKCDAFIGKNIVDARYKKLIKARTTVVMDYFRAKGVHRQVKLSQGVNHIPYNGFSFFKIEYKGDLPYDLYKAYSTMNDLDNEPPRRRFKKERRRKHHLDPTP